MGIDYSFQVYAPRGQAGRLLTAVAALCDPSRDERTTVIAPDGTALVLPGTYGWKAGQAVTLADVVAARNGSSFDLSLCFPQDEPLRAYRDGAATDHRDVGRAWPDGTARVLVALVYLSVFDGSSLLPDHWVFDFTPATSEQSRLFLASPSIRQTFATLALSTAGPLCLLDVEEVFAIVVTALHRQVSVQVPGPCLLWDRRGPKNQAYRELLTRLADPAPTTPPKWIIGPGAAGYDTFVDDLARHSRIAGTVC